MCSSVARSAHGYKVLLGITARVTTKLFVVNFQVRHRAAGLTPPAVATQHLLAQTFVRDRIQPKAGGFGVNHSQDAF